MLRRNSEQRKPVKTSFDYEDDEGCRYDSDPDGRELTIKRVADHFREDGWSVEVRKNNEERGSYSLFFQGMKEES